AHEAFDLFKGEDFSPRFETHVLGRHAIETANVAAVGNADPQVVVPAAEAIDQRVPGAWAWSIAAGLSRAGIGGVVGAVAHGSRMWGAKLRDGRCRRAGPMVRLR